MAARFLLIGAALIATVLSAPAQSSEAETKVPPSATKVAGAPGGGTTLISGRVISVTDGDTITVRRKDRSNVEVRLQGIDAPEGTQKYGDEARRKLSDLVLNNTVVVLLHKRDTYGRYVGSVYRRGRDVGLEMVRTGMAAHFKEYAHEQNPDDRKNYSAAEAEARTNSVGLWADPNRIQPSPKIESNVAATPPSAKSASAAETPKADPSGEKKYLLGPRGGCYYVAEDGRKVYVKNKSLCTAGAATKDQQQ